MFLDIRMTGGSLYNFEELPHQRISVNLKFFDAFEFRLNITPPTFSTCYIESILIKLG
jgi:hypothetical protein